MSEMKVYRQRPIRIRFNADTSTDMRWQFKPQQSEVRVVPGESALAFYTATNPTDEAITGACVRAGYICPFCLSILPFSLALCISLSLPSFFRSSCAHEHGHSVAIQAPAERGAGGPW